MANAVVTGSVEYTVKKNIFGDELAIIPRESSVAFGSVLMRVDIDVVIKLGDQPAKNMNVAFRVTGTHSNARLLRPTDKDGKSTLRMETRYMGVNTITPQAPEYRASTFDVNITEAWYEAGFLITAYNCCDEDDFTGELVDGKGVGKHKKDFLYGGRGVIMQGTGKGSDGKYIQITNPRDITWNPGYSGVANPDDAKFANVDHVQGAYGAVTEDHSIAIDPSVLPPRHRVNIIGPRAIGERTGDDTGGAIRGYHFDNFVGAGQAVVKAWENAGGNIQNARVKYLGS